MQRTMDLILEESGMTIKEVAEASGLSPKRVLSIIDGCWLPSPTERKLLASVFDLGVDDVAWGHTMPPRNVRYHQFGLKEDLQSDSTESSNDGGPESPS